MCAHRSTVKTRFAASCLGTLAAVLLATGCTAPQPVKGAWHRVDLVSQKPAIDQTSPDIGGAKPSKRVISYLGLKEIRDRAVVHPSNFERVPQLSAGELRALQQVVGTRLRWSVELGQEPYLSFIPLRNDERRLPFVYRVGVRVDDGPLRILHETEARSVAPPGQAKEYVDLSEYAGKTIDLLFELAPPRRMVRPTPRARGLWGNPAIYSRKPTERTATPPERPNILLIGADTLRTDALGAYGATPSVTPGLDHLAEESDVWMDAITSFNVTNPSFISLMTGLYGKNHGVYNLTTPLPYEATTLAELFSGAGYATAAVISARHLGHHASGLGQGFDVVQVSDHHASAEYAVDQMMDWIAQQQEPFFGWLHLFDPHTPHTPPAPYGLGFRPLRDYGLSPPREWIPFRNPGWVRYVHVSLGGQIDLYTGEVAYMDRQVARMMDFLDSRGLLENTIVVFVADHGENLEDHGILYGHHGLWETTTHVPLMIRWPGPRNGSEHKGRRIEGLVQNIDIFPTLTSFVGIEAPTVDGQDLRQLTEGGRGRRAAFTEHAHQSGTRVRTQNFAYMMSQGNPFLEDGAYLYDLRSDPDELENLAGTGHPQEEELDRVLKAWVADRRDNARPLPADLSEEDVQRLRALGY